MLYYIIIICAYIICIIYNIYIYIIYKLMNEALNGSFRRN